MYNKKNILLSWKTFWSKITLNSPVKTHDFAKMVQLASLREHWHVSIESFVEIEL